ncbi:hypothetical protein TIFTF001_019857 [Ficus carica]|uniref:Uncharacterized protein n=1 Tax=Ficus carica TaxID=3494 RepID=A0AA88AEA9_FICCA|nr:hypothetical protein TIFTF001_019857 [Ficus carica]
MSRGVGVPARTRVAAGFAVVFISLTVVAHCSNNESEVKCSKTCVAENCNSVGIRYGKFCGVGWTGCPGEKPCDDLDACCKIHDECVTKKVSLNTAIEALAFELAVFLYARFLLLPNVLVVVLDHLAFKFSLKRRILLEVIGILELIECILPGFERHIDLRHRLIDIKCHEKFKKCIKKVQKSGKVGFSRACPYETAVPTMVQGMDLAILLSQFGNSNDELRLLSVSPLPCPLFITLVFLPIGAHLLVGLAGHSSPNRYLAGLASQPLSNRDKKLGAGHGGEQIFDGEGRPRGEQGGGGSQNPPAGREFKQIIKRDF